MKRTGGWRAVLGVGLALAVVTAVPAQATDDTEKYQGDKKNVSVTVNDPPPSYDGANTTFTFKLAATSNVSHVVLMACPGTPFTIVSVTGPQGANKEGDTPKQDSSIKDEGHVGIKFEPGVPGTYTITFAGNVAGAQFVVKDGDGHKHFTAGDSGRVCQGPVSTQQPPPTPSGEQQQPPPGQNPSNPGGQGASNQPGQAGTQVAGNTQTKPGSDVLGDQLTAPEAQAALPRTGLPIPALAPIGTMLLALGGLATALGRWPRRG